MSAPKAYRPKLTAANGVRGPRLSKPRTLSQLRADYEAEMHQRSAARWARWEGQERFGDDG